MANMIFLAFPNMKYAMKLLKTSMPEAEEYSKRNQTYKTGFSASFVCG